MAKRGTAAGKGNKSAKAYDHKGQPAVLRPDIGLQAPTVGSKGLP
jgi:hypothetical protein